MTSLEALVGSEAALPPRHPIETLASGLLDRGVEGTREAAAWRVPGRVELLGKHLDYCGGQSLTIATEPALWIVATRGEAPSLRLLDHGLQEEIEFDLQTDIDRDTPETDWAIYPATVARHLRFQGLELCGIDAAMVNEVPQAAGLSTSSVLVVAAYLALSWASHGDTLLSRDSSRLELAEMLGSVEAGSFDETPVPSAIGTEGGAQDHTAILCSRPWRAELYSYRPLERRGGAAWPREWTVAVASSGVTAQKATGVQSDYNRLARLAAAGVEAFGRKGAAPFHHFGQMARDGIDERNFRAVVDKGIAGFSPRELYQRYLHFLLENETLLEGYAGLVDRDLLRFGKAVSASHDAGARLLENQVPETEHLAASALRLGAAGASAFGAGFGGSVWAVVQADGRDAFLDRWQESYELTFAMRRGTFFSTAPAAGAERLV